MMKNSVSRLVRRGLPILLGLTAVVGCGNGGQPENHRADNTQPRGSDNEEEPAIVVRVADVVREPIASLYSTSATLRADRRATVIARTRGVVRRLAVEEGDQVEAGQPLAFLEDEEQKIAAARSRTAEETARREHERLSGLFDRGLVSVDDYEASRRDAEDAKHALDLAELELSRTVIRAPIAGMVITRHLDVGATVSDGTPVYDLADLDPLYADVNVPERHVTQLSPGQEVRLTADSTGTRASALIERIAPAVDPATGTVKVTVAVQGGTGLRPGAFVRVDIVTDTHDDALVVPRSALVAEGRRWQLFRLAEDGVTVEQIEVGVGFENGNRVEIDRVVEEGVEIQPGDQVVVVGAPALSDKARVRVIQDDGPATPAGEQRTD